MIRNLSDPKCVVQTAAVDIDHMVISVLASLSKDALSFDRASKQYNSDFFKTEDLETRTRLCTALDDFFAPLFLNSYWGSHRQQDT